MWFCWFFLAGVGGWRGLLPTFYLKGQLHYRVPQVLDFFHIKITNFGLTLSPAFSCHWGRNAKKTELEHILK